MKRRLPEPHRNNARANSSSNAFARVELCVVLAALALLSVIALPALANNKSRSQRLVCVSNLSRIGQAYAQWASDHWDYYPFLLGRSLGGTRPPFNGLESNPWLQFSWVSNELATPRILACPGDTKRVAEDFSANLGGLLHPNYQNNAISYFLAHPVLDRILSGDRSLTVNRGSGACSYFSAVNIIDSRSFWAQSIHDGSGNLLFRDGSVEETGTPELRRSIGNFVSMHLILP